MAQDMTNYEAKTWEARSNEERLESVYNFSKMIIATAIKHEKEFWKEDRSKEEIDKAMPYNPKTGAPYVGITSIILQAMANIKGYENNQFLTMKQANTMGGRLKPLLNENGEQVISEKTGKPQYEQGTKISMMKNYELVPKLDDNGKPIMQEYMDKNTGKMKEVPVMQKVFLNEPKVETLTIYHVSQFDNLDHSKFKEKNMSNVEKLRHEFRNTAREPQVAKQLYKLKLSTKTHAALETYLNAQNKGIDYKVPEISKNKLQEQTQEALQKTKEKEVKTKKAGMER